LRVSPSIIVSHAIKYAYDELSPKKTAPRSVSMHNIHYATIGQARAFASAPMPLGAEMRKEDYDPRNKILSSAASSKKGPPWWLSPSTGFYQVRFGC
jgi:hypothetical protein